MKRYSEAEIKAKAQELYGVMFPHLGAGHLVADQFQYDRWLAVARHVLGVVEETEDEKAGRRARVGFYEVNKYFDVRHITPWENITPDERANWIAAAKAARGGP